MIVMSDGDVGLNQVYNGKAFHTSYDTWTGQIYGNDDFLMHCMDYLLEDQIFFWVYCKKVLPYVYSTSIDQAHKKMAMDQYVIANWLSFIIYWSLRALARKKTL